MKSNNHKSIVGAVLLAAGLYLGVGAAAYAQELAVVLDAGASKNQAGRTSQQRIDQVVEQTRSLFDQYRTVNKQISGLEVYNELLESQIANQERNMATLVESIAQVTVIERQIMPLMQRMIDGLDRFIQLDLPFNMDERTDRVAKLRAILERADVSTAEKFRRVMEGYDIENEFGRTIEAYSQTIEIEGAGTVEVDVLRVGRLAILYQSRDASLTGMWDNTAKEWVSLSGNARNHVRKALRVAKNEVPPDLIQVPMPAPVEVTR